MRRWRIIPDVDRHDGVVAFCRTSPGRSLVICLAAALLYLIRRDLWIESTIVIALATLLPTRRMLVVAIMGCLYPTLTTMSAVVRTGVSPETIINALAGQATGFALAATFCWAAHHWRPALLTRHPVATLLVLALSLLATLTWGILPAGAWPVVSAFLGYLWFLAYSLAPSPAELRGPSLLQAAMFRPFWGGTSTPFPKADTYLRRVAAKNDRELAISQIKGLKLLAWTGVLIIARDVVNLALGYDSGAALLPDHLWPSVVFPGFPSLASAVMSLDSTEQVSRALGWAVVMVNLLLTVLNLSIMGHGIIAVCRLCGFNALRNTYAPIGARTIWEFFNRYYFYFKELLVDFFFYPAFLTTRGWPRPVRVFFATFAAAGFGNFVFHYLLEIDAIRARGMWDAFVSFQWYASYCLVLALGIGLSQLVSQWRVSRGFPTGHWLRGRVVTIAFYALLQALLVRAGDPWAFVAYLILPWGVS